MSKKKIISLISIAILLACAAVASVISYSIATRESNDSIEDENVLAQSTVTRYGDTTYVTNIDLIIKNAIAGVKYNIVEVIPNGATASDLGTYISNEYFSTYVLSANKSSSADNMPAGSINFTTLTLNSTTLLTDEVSTDVTVQDVLDAADLIYLNSPAYDSYNGANNMSEDLYNYLHYYALGNYKPIILDYVIKGTTATAAKTYYNFMMAVKRNYVKYRTYPWNDGVTAADFFAAKGSYYIKKRISAKANGKILVLAASSATANDSIRKRIEDYADAKKAAYIGLDTNYPDSLSFQQIDMSAAGAETTLLTELTKDYEFIIIEKDVKSIALSTEAYKKLQQWSESSKYIIFDGNAIGDGTSQAESSANNYLKLMNLLVTSSGVAKANNVLPVSNGFFTSLVDLKENGTTGAKQIADIINRGAYRDSANSGETSRKYRVLEIEPCYPVDLDIAESHTGGEQSETGPVTTKYDYSKTGIKGGYYTVPDQVLYGVSPDEIESGTEYYAFELSKAKIAHVTGIPVDQIQIDYVSANELISDKPVISESYDLVYIGGDATALIPYTAVNYWGDTGFTFKDDSNWNNIINGGMTAFDMYQHTGNFVTYNWSYYKVGDETNSVTTNGYDISTIKLQELKDYIDAGLPILIDQEVTDAFEESYKVRKNRLQQLALHNIDPDSNMYKFLEYAYKKKSETTSPSLNVGWAAINSPSAVNDLTKKSLSAEEKTALTNGTLTYAQLKNRDVQLIDNTDGTYGNTVHSTTVGDQSYTYATVYGTTTENKIKSAIQASAERPKLSLASYPKEYVEGDTSTTNKTKTVAFKAASDKACTFELYVDKNGDGVYAEGELQAGPATGTSADLSFELEDGFFGLVNWKVIIKDSSNAKLCDAIMGSSFFKPEDEMKKTCRILQIMPVDADNGSIGDNHSLYFCTDCQQSSKRLTYNVTVNSTQHDGALGVNSFSDNATTYISDDADNPTVNLGLHEHNFGIVKFDSTTNMDDWEDNLADILTHGKSGSMSDGEFEFELEIVTIPEFQALCNAAAAVSDTDAENNLKDANDIKGQYTDILDGVTDPGNASYGAAQALKQAQADLESEIYNSIDAITGSSSCKFAEVIKKGIGSEDKPGQWMLDKHYYKLWEYLNSDVNNSVTVPGSLKKKYNAYVAEYNNVITLKKQYRNKMHLSGKDYKWLSNSYDIIVLGLADQFNGQDLNPEASQQLKDYVANGGSILNSHDTLVAGVHGNNTLTAGSVNLTNALREEFGMDRFHVTNNAGSMATTISGQIPGESTIELAAVKAQATTVKIISSGDFNPGIDEKKYELNLTGDSNILLTSTQSDAQDTHINPDKSAKVTISNDGAATGSTVRISIAFTNDNQWSSVTGQWAKKIYVCLPDGMMNGQVKYAIETPGKYFLFTPATDGSHKLVADVELPAEATGSKEFTVSNKDVVISIPETGLNDATIADASPEVAHNSITDNIKVTVKTEKAGESMTLGMMAGTATTYDFKTVNNAGVDYYAPVGTTTASYSFDLASNVTIDWDAVTGTASETNDGAVTGTDYVVKVKPKRSGTAFADGEALTCYFRGANTTATVTGGVATFNLTAAAVDDSIDALLTATPNPKYRKYSTVDGSKYFWTERICAATSADYASVIAAKNLGSMIKYNAPVGITDVFASYDTKSIARANYRYAMTEPESFNHASNVNGVTFEAKYGTRRANRVNKGGVTMYPFAISSELLISPTHGQAFALDLEDPSVAVWYTLGANFVSTDPETSAYFARYDSSFYAASPRDGMNSYFLYSKENVFYTGAGHQLVTGSKKDNNDERRLFINVIVNSVSKGKAKPKLKLYNVCDEADHENCEDNYVDPDDSTGNADLKKSLNTLFYNEADFMYQYNIDDSMSPIYPMFDFKAIAGSESIKNIKVFWDLDYNTIESNEYVDNSNHVLIKEYSSNASSMNGKRVRLRQSGFSKLLLKDDYFKNYHNCTYIVIRVQDTAGNVTSARIKINAVPHLFDLTDATDSQSVGTIILDMNDVIDKKQFEF